MDIRLLVFIKIENKQNKKKTKKNKKTEKTVKGSITLANQYQKPFMSLKFLIGQKIVSGRSQERNGP